MRPFCFVTSGSGRLLEQVAVHSPDVRAALVAVITDRECEAEQVARRLGVRQVRLQSTRNPAMSDEILELGNRMQVSLFVLLFNRLVAGQLLVQYENRIVNLHPTLLPAFPGLSGLRDSLESGTRFLGSTIHFVDESSDGGPIILQAVMPRDTEQSIADLRRAHFEQMCKATLQVAEWHSDDRLRVHGGKVEVLGASYRDADFSPALDSVAARSFTLVDAPADRRSH